MNCKGSAIFIEKVITVTTDPARGNIDLAKIEAAITPHTSAIMSVHVYGNPFKTNEIQEIADHHGLKVICDAAHAFGVKMYGESMLNAGINFAEKG